jgi:hypothetical protein
MNTLDRIIEQTNANRRQIKDIFKLIEDWKRENYENCIRYCQHRSVMTTDQNKDRVCALCGRK